MRAAQSRGRRFPEAEAPYRGLYQRDRDRIIHCAAFRRLEYKTQVFVHAIEGDHYRNRLTHTMEVTQIARTLARVLGLNEDLVEALALAHDLGHGPFGHAGESALDEVTRAHGGFNHNLQGLRSVDLLERRYPDFPGLNLSYETREGFAKNLSPQRRAASGFSLGEAPALEVQLVAHADEIAYNTHDLEDGLVSHVLQEDALRTVELWRVADAEVCGEHAVLGRDHRLRWRAIVRRLIRKLAGDLLAETERRLAQAGIQSAEDVRACPRELAGYSAAMTLHLRELGAFLHQFFYSHDDVRRHSALWEGRLKELFQAYLADPARLPEDHRKRVAVEHEPLERVICDYVAGMTDRYAEQQWIRFGKA